MTETFETISLAYEQDGRIYDPTTGIYLTKIGKDYQWLRSRLGYQRGDQLPSFIIDISFKAQFPNGEVSYFQPPNESTWKNQDLDQWAIKYARSLYAQMS